MRLTLLVPELIWPEPGDQFTLGKLLTPGLNELLIGHEWACAPRRSFEDTLTGLFGLASPAFGALRLLGETGIPLPGDGYWLCADPVHLRFHHERIILADAGAFELTLEEAQELTQALNAQFADIGQFVVGNAKRWYLKLNDTIPHRADPISAVAGRRVDGNLSGEQSPLTRWLNEVQMFLHGLPVNERRQAMGHPAINSLWLWGAGPLPSGLPTRFTQVWSDNPLAIGLARAVNVPTQSSTDPGSVLNDTHQTGEHLVVFDQLLSNVLYENGDGWRQTWETLDRDWLAPLAARVGRDIESVTLLAPTIYGSLSVTVDGKNRWKFWKRLGQKPLSLAERAQKLAEEKRP